MKKFIIMLAAALPMVFTSCGDDNDDTMVSLDQTAMTINYDDEVTLKASEKNCTWTSSNPFVATVDQDGKVEAKHVGEAEISAAKNGAVAKCKVTVNAKYNYYTMPCLKWDANVATVKSEVKGFQLDEANSTDTRLEYWSNLANFAFPAYQYIFNAKGGLDTSILIVEDTEENLEKLNDWLLQYYNDTSAEGSDDYIMQYGYGSQMLQLDYLGDDTNALSVTWVSPASFNAPAARSAYDAFSAAKASAREMVKNRK